MNLEKGINFGGWLSQCIHTKEHYDSFITKEDVIKVSELGFDHIRLPFDYEVIQNKDGSFIEEGFARLYDFVQECRQNNLNVVLDLHKACGYDFNDAGTEKGNSLFDSSELQKMFISLWDEVSKRFANCQNVAYELLNEVVEQNAADAWNKLIAQTVTVIRKNAPKTPVIYGGIQWNSASTLKFLEKPVDENIIWTFHEYEPLIFTHQKAPWVPGMDLNKQIKYPAKMSYFREESISLGYKGKDVTDITDNYDGNYILQKLISEAVEVAEKNNVKLYCGEYGVIDRAPTTDTLAWFKDIHQEFTKFHINHAVWTYKKMDFGITDEHYKDIFKDLVQLMTK